MNTTEQNTSPEKKGLKYFHYEAGATGLEEAGNAYQSASMVAVGSDWHGVGVLSGFTNLAASLLYLRVPSVVRLLGSAKRAVLALSLLDALTWLPILLVMLFLSSVNSALLIALWMVNLVPGILLGPVRTAWMVSFTSPEKRGKYLGLRLSINTASYLISFYAMGYLLQGFSGEQVFSGFAIVFFMALVGTLVGVFIYSRIPNSPNATPEDDSFRFTDFLRETHTRNLGRFVLFTALFTFTVYLAAPFFAVYMLNDLQFGYVTFAVISSSELIARTIAMPIWGCYVNRFGNLKLVRVATLLIPLVPLLWLVSPNLVYLVLVQVFSGIVWAGFDLCTPNFIFQTVSAEKRLKYLVFHRALSMAAMSLGGLTAVMLFSRVNPFMGSPILAMFLLSGILRLVVALIMLCKVRDLHKNAQALPREPLIVPAQAPAIVTTPGYVHRSARWSYLKNLATAKSEPSGKEGPAIHPRVGLIARPREWNRYNRSLAPAPALVHCFAAAPAVRGIFYRPQLWHLLAR